jgi:DNA-binding PadR family transcriptional regulator
MPNPKPTPAVLPSDDLILAALERAILHRGRNEPGESLSSITAHLGLPFHSGTSRRLRPKLKDLEAAGLIRPFRHHSINKWAITPAGQRRLDKLRTSGELHELPESPQHRAWNTARCVATKRITGLRSQVRTMLGEGDELLRADETSSEAWYDLSDRLRDASQRLASATYCLREWPEPNDSQPDSDSPPPNMRSRRGYHNWK